MRVVNDNNLPTAPISEFHVLQGDLKFLPEDNYEKLKKNIEKHGFDIPVYAWVDKNGTKHLLDGHQRKNILETEGWLEPIPYLVIKAKSLEDAAERLLEITSQFGTITQEGIDEYIATFHLPELEIKELTNFDGVFNLPAFAQPDDKKSDLEVEPQAEVDSVEGTLYALGPHRVMCGDPKEGEVSPEKMDAYRKKYHKIMTGTEDGWQTATPGVE